MRGWEERKQRRKEDTLYNKQSRTFAVFKLVKSSAPYPHSGLALSLFISKRVSSWETLVSFLITGECLRKCLKHSKESKGFYFMLTLPPKENSIFPANNRLYSLPERQQPWVTRVATSQCQRAAVTPPCRTLILPPIPSPTYKLPFSVMPMCACQLSASWHKDTAG